MCDFRDSIAIQKQTICNAVAKTIKAINPDSGLKGIECGTTEAGFEHADAKYGDKALRIDITGEPLENLAEIITAHLTWERSMPANNYQSKTLRTGAAVDSLEAVIGLNEEAGEVAGIIKKSTYQGEELDYTHLAKELGDTLWYLAILANLAGYKLEEIMKINLRKLEERYPDGFSEEKSIHRRGGDI